MEPFGPENLKPIYCVRNVNNIGCKIVKENHVRFVVEQDGIIFNGIGFNLAEKYLTIPQEDTLDLVFTLDENTFNQQTSLQLKVTDLASSYAKFAW